MRSDWKEYKISDIANVIGGGTPKTSVKEYGNGQIPWLAPKDLTGYTDIYISHGNRFITELGLKKSSTKLMPKGSVLFTSRAPIGYVAIAQNEICTNQGFKSLKPNQKLCNSEFLYYWIKNNVNYLKQLGTGTTFAEISGSVLKEVNISLPSLQTQKKIAHILSTLDNKIELNRKTNQTLEKIAQTLFKSWFIDFDPVKAKTKGGDSQTIACELGISQEVLELFSSEFVDSEMGVIPKGWEVKTLEELVNITSSKRIFSREYIKNGIPFYRSKEIINFSKGEDLNDILYISKERFLEIKTKFSVPKKNDILITSVGTIGKIYLVPDNSPFYFKDGNLTWINEYTNIPPLFIFSFLKSKKTQQQINSVLIGSTQKALTIKNINKLQVIVPSLKLLNIFSSQIESISNIVQKNRNQIQTLQKTRDTLLPKLLLGELDLSGIENS